MKELLNDKNFRNDVLKICNKFFSGKKKLTGEDLFLDKDKIIDQTAKDLAQEFFLIILEDKERIAKDLKDKPVTYVYEMVKNWVYNRVFKKKRQSKSTSKEKQEVNPDGTVKKFIFVRRLDPTNKLSLETKNASSLDTEDEEGKLVDFLDEFPDPQLDINEDLEKNQIFKLAFSKLRYKDKRLLVYIVRKRLTMEKIAEKTGIPKRTIERRKRKITETLTYWVDYFKHHGVFTLMLFPFAVLLFLSIRFGWINPREGFIQKPILLKHEIQKEKKEIKRIKKFINKEEPRENNWQKAE